MRWPLFKLLSVTTCYACPQGTGALGCRAARSCRSPPHLSRAARVEPLALLLPRALAPSQGLALTRAQAPATVGDQHVWLQGTSHLGARRAPLTRIQRAGGVLDSFSRSA